MDDEAIGRICAFKSPLVLCCPTRPALWYSPTSFASAQHWLRFPFSLLSFDQLIRSEDRRRYEAATLSFELLVFLLSLVDLVVVVVVVSSVVVVIVEVVVSFSWAFLRTHVCWTLPMSISTLRLYTLNSLMEVSTIENMALLVDTVMMSRMDSSHITLCSSFTYFINSLVQTHRFLLRQKIWIFEFLHRPIKKVVSFRWNSLYEMITG